MYRQRIALTWYPGCDHPDPDGWWICVSDDPTEDKCADILGNMLITTPLCVRGLSDQSSSFSLHLLAAAQRQWTERLGLLEMRRSRTDRNLQATRNRSIVELWHSAGGGRARSLVEGQQRDLLVIQRSPTAEVTPLPHTRLYTITLLAFFVRDGVHRENRAGCWTQNVTARVTDLRIYYSAGWSAERSRQGTYAAEFDAPRPVSPRCRHRHHGADYGQNSPHRTMHGELNTTAKGLGERSSVAHLKCSSFWMNRSPESCNHSTPYRQVRNLGTIDCGYQGARRDLRHDAQFWMSCPPTPRPSRSCWTCSLRRSANDRT